MSSDSQRSWPHGVDSVEIFWTLVSLLAMESADQLRCLGRVPSRDAHYEELHSHSRNPLVCLGAAFDDWYSLGWDILDPNVEALERLKARFDMLVEADFRADRGGGAGLFCREELETGRDWQEIRELARAALQAAGERPRPVPEPVPFEELIEFQS